jgi:aldehyde:ferredoxin oxidoreductase
MTERFGYWDKILHVDMTAGTTWTESLGDAWFRKFGGGRALIAHYLLKDVPAGADALSPENVLVFAPGVVTGSPVPGAGRHSVGGKSPLNNGFGESEAGGYWGAELKRAGWDGIIVHGASQTPKYLWIKDGEVELRDATQHWGKVAIDVEDKIREELGEPHCRITQCGIAGEKLVRFALVANDLNEVAGRTGLGAVMGSKKLKAIAVRGTQPVPIADKEGLKAIAKWVSSTLDENHRAFHDYGTGAAMQGKNLEGGMPTLNYRMGKFDEIAAVDAIAVAEQFRVDMGACFACSVRCKKVVQVEQFAEDAVPTRKGKPVNYDPQGRWSVNPRYGGPEYESLAALGPSVGVSDLVALLKSNELCNALGIDTISTGATIAWAMEAFEKGMLTGADTGGVELSWGSGNTVVKLIEMIANREGFGDLLAEGSERAAAKIGRGSEKFLTTVKGMEMAMHDPRHMERMRQSYMLAPTGGDHMGQQDTKNAGRNSVGLCHFLAYNNDQSLDLLNAVTGWGVDQAEWEQVAARGLTMARLFNMREGVRRQDDRLPARFSEDLPMHKGVSLEQQGEIVTEYYTRMGWDAESGLPTTATMTSLGMGDYAASREAILV